MKETTKKTEKNIYFPNTDMINKKLSENRRENRRELWDIKNIFVNIKWIRWETIKNRWELEKPTKKIQSINVTPRRFFENFMERLEENEFGRFDQGKDSENRTSQEIFKV